MRLPVCGWQVLQGWHRVTVIARGALTSLRHSSRPTAAARHVTAPQGMQACKGRSTFNAAQCRAAGSTVLTNKAWSRTARVFHCCVSPVQEKRRHKSCAHPV